jgi:glycogen debranching enzyme
MKYFLLTLACLASMPSGISWAQNPGVVSMRPKWLPSTLEEATAWLKVASCELIRGSRRPMADSVSAFCPQAGSGYEAFWLRDYAYMLEGNIDAFTFDELRAACLLFVRAQRSDGACVDRVQFDGTPLYRPGPRGEMGENPVADGSQFTVAVAWHTYRRTRDRELVRSIIDRLIRAMEAVPRNPSTGLVHIRPGGWDRCPYGFTDTIRKQGDVLFSSLLFVQAAGQLADLLVVCGRKAEASRWRDDAEHVAAGIRQTFWDDTTGLFRAATVQCREHDVWGSAFAVWLGVATPAQADRVAQYFKEHYDGIVKRGQVRHLPKGEYWEVGCARDQYQNGAYWATPVGWVVYTLDRVDPALADQTVVAMVRDFIEQGDINECVNDGYKNVSRYVVSATLPLEGIRAMMAGRLARKNSSEKKNP